MKMRPDILDMAINAVRNEFVPAGPPRELTDSVLIKLTQAQGPQAAAIQRIKTLRKVAMIAAAAVIILAVLLAIQIFTGLDKKQPAEPVVRKDEPPTQEAIEVPKKDVPEFQETITTRKAIDKLNEELNKIEQMFAAGDIDGLAAMLSEGEYQSKIAAANYLAIIGDTRVLEALEDLSRQWEGDETDNPFAKAIEAIKKRIESLKTAPGVGAQDKTKTQRGEITPTSVLSGLVTDAETGEPISDLRINIHGRASASFKTDANGFYHVDKVEQEGEYKIEIDSKEYVSITDDEKMPVVALYDDSNMVKHFALQPACMIEVKVVNEDGEPIEKAHIIVSSLASELSGTADHVEKTGQDGMATLGAIVPSETDYLITVMHNIYETQDKSLEVVGHDYAPAKLLIKLNDTDIIEYGEIVMKKGVAVRGYLEYRDGIPAGGFKVIARPDWWHCKYNAPGYNVDPNGYFTMSHVEPGQYTMRVMIPQGGGSWSLSTVSQTKLPLQEDELLIVTIPQESPEALVSISGTITYIGDQEPDYVSIGVWSPTGGRHSKLLNRYSTKDSNDLSHFTIDGLKPGNYSLSFSGKNIALTTINDVKAPRSDLEVELSYQVKPKLEGVVVKAGTDKPVKQFKARVKKVKHLPGGYYDDSSEWREFLSNNGTFNIEVAGRGLYQIQVMAEGFAPTFSKEIDTREPELVFIELGPGGAIKGKVVNENGEPVSGATVIPLCKAGEIRHDRKSIFVSQEGAVQSVRGGFLLKHLSAGSETIKVVHPDYSDVVVKDIEVVEGQTIETIEIVMTRGGTVEGFVYDSQGKPQPNVRLFVQDTLVGNDKAGRIASVVTDSNGFYRIERLPEKLCYIRRAMGKDSLGVARRGLMPVNEQIVRLDFGGAPQITGQIMVEGKPLSNTKVLMGDLLEAHAGSFMCYAMTDNDGEFVFRGPPPGKWMIYHKTSNQEDMWAKVAPVDVGSEDMDVGVISPVSVKE